MAAKLWENSQERDTEMTAVEHEQTLIKCNLDERAHKYRVSFKKHPVWTAPVTNLLETLADLSADTITPSNFNIFRENKHATERGWEAKRPEKRRARTVLCGIGGSPLLTEQRT